MSSEKTCKCNFDDDGGRCVVCDKSFENLSSFVMHVTHSKNCKANYDPKLISEYKEISRQISRRKWYCNAAHGIRRKWFKEERKKHYQENKKNYYVPYDVKCSHSGRAFEKVFKKIYENLLDNAKAMIETESLEKENLMDDALDQAMDETFEDSSLEMTFTRILDNPAIGNRKLEIFMVDENLIWDTYFKRLDKDFKRCRERLQEKIQQEWRHDKYFQVSVELYQSVLNKAFLVCYDQTFKDMYEKAVDLALDVIFLTLVTKEEYFNDYKDLECQMSEVYRNVLVEEVDKLFEEKQDLKNELKAIIEKALKKRFQKNGLKYFKE